MDNKRVYRKVSTIFWFILATMFFWLPVIFIIFSVFLHTENNTSFNNSDINLYPYLSEQFQKSLSQMFAGDFLENLPFPFIKEMFVNLFDLFEFDFSFSTTDWIISSLSWFVSVYFFELIVDFVVWLPKLCHEWMQKCGG